MLRLVYVYMYYMYTVVLSKVDSVLSARGTHRLYLARSFALAHKALPSGARKRPRRHVTAQRETPGDIATTHVLGRRSSVDRVAGRVGTGSKSRCCADVLDFASEERVELGARTTTFQGPRD